MTPQPAIFRAQFFCALAAISWPLFSIGVPDTVAASLLEPTSLLIFGGGLFGVAAAIRRRRLQKH